MFTAAYILILRLKIHIVSSVTYLEPDKRKDHLPGCVKAPLHALSVLEKTPAQGASALNRSRRDTKEVGCPVPGSDEVIPVVLWGHATSSSRLADILGSSGLCHCWNHHWD